MTTGTPASSQIISLEHKVEFLEYKSDFLEEKVAKQRERIVALEDCVAELQAQSVTQQLRIQEQEAHIVKLKEALATTSYWLDIFGTPDDKIINRVLETNKAVLEKTHD